MKPPPHDRPLSKIFAPPLFAAHANGVVLVWQCCAGPCHSRRRAAAGACILALGGVTNAHAASGAATSAPPVAAAAARLEAGGGAGPAGCWRLQHLCLHCATDHARHQCCAAELLYPGCNAHTLRAVFYAAAGAPAMGGRTAFVMGCGGNCQPRQLHGFGRLAFQHWRLVDAGWYLRLGALHAWFAMAAGGGAPHAVARGIYHRGPACARACLRVGNFERSLSRFECRCAGGYCVRRSPSGVHRIHFLQPRGGRSGRQYSQFVHPFDAGVRNPAGGGVSGRDPAALPLCGDRINYFWHLSDNSGVTGVSPLLYAFGSFPFGRGRLGIASGSSGSADWHGI